MSRWWRAYDEAVDNPKLIMLTDAQHRAWFNLCCLASHYNGTLPGLPVIALKLRVNERKAAALIQGLKNAGLIDLAGTDLVMHDWNSRQYKSDVSTDRVKQFRKRQRNVSSAVSETPPDTETETEDVVEGSARASLISEEAFAITSDLLGVFKIDPAFIPPGWCGAPMRIQSGLNSGWQREIIIMAAQKVAAKGFTPDSFAYLEKPIARAHAEAAQPVPIVETRQSPEVIHAPIQRQRSDWQASRDEGRSAHADLKAAIAEHRSGASGGQVVEFLPPTGSE